MKYCSQRKYIAVRVEQFLVGFSPEDFRSHVSRGATSGEEILISIDNGSKSKISNDDIKAIFIFKEDIFRFDIPVDDVFGMEVGQT